MVDNRAQDILDADLCKHDEISGIKSSKTSQSRDAYPMLEINNAMNPSDVDLSRPEDPPPPSTRQSSSWLQSSVAVYFHIAIFAMIGCATRIGLEKLLGPNLLNIEFAGSMVPVSFYSNMVGSLILGLLAGSTLKSLQGMLPIYTGLSTGLCGSITTYSKFNQQISLMIVGEAETEGDRYFTAFSAILLGIAAPICSYEFGQDISKEMLKIIRKRGTDFRISKRTKFIQIFNLTSVGLCLTVWVVLLALSIAFADNDNLVFINISIVMAPFGAISRFLLAKWNTNQANVIPNIKLKLGTFYANFIGSLVLALTHVAMTWSILTCPWYNVLRAVQTGFCACLSTVSTFVGEISGMRGNNDILSSHFYPFFTIFLCEVAACI